MGGALLRSAFEPVKESPSPLPKRSSSSSLELSFRLLFFKITFPVLDFLQLFICERCTDITGSFEGDTGVISLASLPTGRAVVV